ncbi:MAG: toxin-antitoxin system HicB family antitoxin [Ignavibacteriales bacterium CG18_big_fil_WC_8_21_14_2_50_31_20]|nr:MAG: toxin-antitoxin system HicB family antitoxin [Ignavibacteriales bacterium CG18_big_fil_WC_8_21_14_2_50_31_20]
MSVLSLRIPESLHKRVKILANDDNISINQFITSALAKKLSALDTEKYLEDRTLKGSKDKFSKALSKVPDVAPDEYDRL